MRKFAMKFSKKTSIFGATIVTKLCPRRSHRCHPHYYSGCSEAPAHLTTAPRCDGLGGDAPVAKRPNSILQCELVWHAVVVIIVVIITTIDVIIIFVDITVVVAVIIVVVFIFIVVFRFSQLSESPQPEMKDKHSHHHRHCIHHFHHHRHHISTISSCLVLLNQKCGMKMRDDDKPSSDGKPFYQSIIFDL